MKEIGKFINHDIIIIPELESKIVTGKRIEGTINRKLIRNRIRETMNREKNISHSTGIIIHRIGLILHLDITAHLQDHILRHRAAQGILEVPEVHIIQEGGDKLK